MAKDYSSFDTPVDDPTPDWSTEPVTTGQRDYASFDAPIEDTAPITPKPAAMPEEEPSFLGNVAASWGVGSGELAEGIGQLLGDWLGWDSGAEFVKGVGQRAKEYWKGSVPEDEWKRIEAETQKQFATLKEDGDWWKPGDWERGEAGLESLLYMAIESAPATVATLPVAGLGGKAAMGALSKLPGMQKLIKTSKVGRLAEAAGGSTAAIQAGKKADKILNRIQMAVTGATYGAAEGAISAGMSMKQVEEQVDAMRFEDLLLKSDFATDIYEAHLAEGIEPEKAANQTREMVKERAKQDVGFKTFMTTAAAGAPMGAFFSSVLLKTPWGKAFASGKVKGLAKGAAGEAAQEAVQSAFEQYWQNEALQRYADETIKLSAGVFEAAVTGAAVGGVMGGAFGVAGTPTKAQAQTAEESQKNQKDLLKVEVHARLAAASLIENHGQTPEQAQRIIEPILKRYAESQNLVEAASDLKFLETTGRMRERGLDNVAQAQPDYGELDVTVEEEAGQERNGKTLKYPAGKINGTVGADGMNIDIVGPGTGNRIFIAEKMGPDGTFEQHKILYGFETQEEALDAFYSTWGREEVDRLGNLTEVSDQELNEHLARWTREYGEEVGPATDEPLTETEDLALRKDDDLEAGIVDVQTQLDYVQNEDGSYPTEAGPLLNRLQVLEEEKQRRITSGEWQQEAGVEQPVEQAVEQPEAQEQGAQPETEKPSAEPVSEEAPRETPYRLRELREGGRTMRGPYPERIRPSEAKGAKKGAVDVDYLHLSREPDLQTLKGGKAGTSGVQRTRAKVGRGRTANRVYIYAQREKAMGGRSASGNESAVSRAADQVYTGTATNLYDFDADPLDLLQGAKMPSEEMEDALLKAGYDGWYYEDFPNVRGGMGVVLDRDLAAMYHGRARSVRELLREPSVFQRLVTWETIPGTQSPVAAAASYLTPKEAQILNERLLLGVVIQKDLRADMLAEAMGLPSRLLIQRWGGYKGKVMPSMQVGLDSALQANLYSAAIKLIYQQDAVPWMHATPKGDKDGIRIQFSKAPTDQQLERFQQELEKNLGEYAGFSVLPDGQIMVGNYNDEVSRSEFALAVDRSLIAIPGGTMTSFKFEGAYRDESQEETQEQFVRWAGEAGRPDLQGWVSTAHARAVKAANEFFEQLPRNHPARQAYENPVDARLSLLPEEFELTPPGEEVETPYVDPFYSALYKAIEEGKKRGMPKKGGKAIKQWLLAAQRKGLFKKEEYDWMELDRVLDDPLSVPSFQGSMGEVYLTLLGENARQLGMRRSELGDLIENNRPVPAKLSQYAVDQMRRAWLASEGKAGPDDFVITREDLLTYMQENQVILLDAIAGAPDRKGFGPYEQALGELLDKVYQISARYGVDENTLKAFADDDLVPFAADLMDPVPEYERNELVRLNRRFVDLEKQKLAQNERRPTKYEEYQLPGARNSRELVIMDPGGRAWSGGHSWNVGDPRLTIAHVRFNDRINSEGQRTLFIEEVQSDRHQAGRKQGYQARDLGRKGAALRKQLVEVGEGINEIVKNNEDLGFDNSAEAQLSLISRMTHVGRGEGIRLHNTVFGFELNTAEEAEQLGDLLWEAKRLRRLLDDVESQQRVGVPPTPFSKTQTWALLVMKRMIRYAAENGYDAIAWTPGDVQNKRYGLERTIEAVRYDLEDSTLYVDYSDGNEWDYTSEQLEPEQISNRENLAGDLPDWMVDTVLTKIDRVKEEAAYYYDVLPLEDLSSEIIEELAQQVGWEEVDYDDLPDDMFVIVDSGGEPLRTWDGSIQYWDREENAIQETIVKAQASDDGIVVWGGDEDSRVGGEGMRGFYDDMLVKEVQKFVKTWGARVVSEGTAVDTEETYGDEGGGDITDAELETLRIENMEDGWLYMEGPEPAHLLQMTPELVEAAMGTGFPMFSLGPDAKPSAQVRARQHAERLHNRLDWTQIDAEVDASQAGAMTAEERQDAIEEWAIMGPMSRYFRQWFGKSQTVDAFGQPLVLYHGTSYSDIRQFRPNKKGHIFVSTDPGFASQFANASAWGWDLEDPENVETNIRPTMYAVYVRANKIFDFRNKAIRRSYSRWLQQQDIYSGDRLQQELDNIKNGDWATIEGNLAQTFMKERGYDAFWVIENDKLNLGLYDPRNIKSAVGNAGTFLSGTADMMFSLDPNEVGNELSRRLNLYQLRAHLQRTTNEGSTAKAVRAHIEDGLKRGLFDRRALQALSGREKSGAEIQRKIEASIRSGDPITSRTALSPVVVQNEINRIMEQEGWQQRPEFSVHADYRGLPPNMRSQVERHGYQNRVEGLVDPYTGKIHIVAGNLSDIPSLHRVFVEEALGHHGLRNFFGPELDTFLDKIIPSVEGSEAWNALLRDYKHVARLIGNQKTAQRGKRLAAEELIAKMDVDQNVWQQFVAWVRSWLRSKGLITNFTEQDLRRVMTQVHNRIINGTTPHPWGQRNHLPAFAGAAPYSIRGWHGSRHEWYTPKLAQIGTGEGVTAYGWGFYVAQNRDVAEYYRHAGATGIGGEGLVDAQGKPFHGSNHLPDAYAENVLLRHQGDYEAARAAVRKSMRSDSMLSDVLDNLDMWEADGVRFEKTEGHLYEIHIEDSIVADMLLWEAPLEDQPDAVKKAIETNTWVKQKLTSWRDSFGGPAITGEAIYKAFAQSSSGGMFEDQQWASQTLRAMGVTGVRYFDAISRPLARAARRATGGLIQPLISAAKGEEEPPVTHNYVLFNERDINVVSRNGIPFSISTKGHINGTGLRGHSVGEHYPLMVIGIGDPNTDLKWAVQRPDGTIEEERFETPAQAQKRAQELAEELQTVPFSIKPDPEYAERYPHVAPREERVDPKTGKAYMGKGTTPESERFMEARARIIDKIKQEGFEPYFDPAQRYDVAPEDYSAQIETLDVKPVQQKVLTKWRRKIKTPTAKKRLQEAYDMGVLQGFHDGWYKMGQLEAEFISEYGEEEGRRQFQERFINAMAATTAGNNPAQNFLIGMYLNYLTNLGLPLPEASSDFPAPLGASRGALNVKTYKDLMAEARYKITQPKTHNFAANFAGHERLATIDSQMGEIITGKKQQELQRIMQNRYGIFEELVIQMADENDVSPREFQEVAWGGYKFMKDGYTGTPMIQIVNEAIERTARITGASPEEVVRRGIVRSEMPIYALRRPRGVDDELKIVNDKIARSFSEMTVLDRVTHWFHQIRDAMAAGDFIWGLKQGVLDDAAVVERYEKELFGELQDAAISPYKAIHSTKNLPSVMAAISKVGIPEYRNGAFVPAQGRKGFVEIFRPLYEHTDGDLLELWEGYAAARRSQRLIGETNPDGTSREKLFTQDEIDKLLALEQRYPEFKDVFDDWTEFNNQLLDLAVEMGVISEAERDAWTRYDYIPFYRAMEEIEGIDQRTGWGRIKAGIEGQKFVGKRLKGGEQKLANVIENMWFNTASMIDKIYKNQAMNRVVDMLEGVAMNEIEMPWEAVRITNGQLASALKAAGLLSKTNQTPLQQVQAMTADQRMQWNKVFRRVRPTAPNVVAVSREGRLAYYEVTDELLLRTLQGMTAEGLVGFMKAMGLSKQLLTRMVTLDPAFMAANWMRDTLSAWVTSDANFVPVLDSIRSAGDVFTESGSYIQMMMSGHGGGGFYDLTGGNVSRVLKEELSHGGRHWAHSTWIGYLKLGAASENSNRLAIANRILKKGGTVAEAMYQAQDIMNFTMSGDYAAIKFLIRTVPFMNARLQGLYRLYRGAKQHPLGFALKGMALAAASLALLARNWDDPDYERMEDWQKDTYWNFFINGFHYAIPKPFEVGVIFGMLPERIARLLLGRDDIGKDTRNALLRMLGETFAFNPVPQLFKPILEQMMDYNFFMGSPIVGQSLAGLEPAATHLQYNPWTSEAAVELGGAMPDWAGKLRSPRRIEHLVRAYTGTMGLYTLNGIDWMIRAADKDRPEPPTTYWYERPVLSRFLKGEAKSAKYNKYTQQLYDVIDESNSAQRAFNLLVTQGRKDDAEEMLRKFAPLVDPSGQATKGSVRKQLLAFQTAMRDINTAQRGIMTSRTMTPDEKRQRLDDLQIKRHEILGQAALLLERLDDFEFPEQ